MARLIHPVYGVVFSGDDAEIAKLVADGAKYPEKKEADIPETLSEVIEQETQPVVTRKRKVHIQD